MEHTIEPVEERDLGELLPLMRSYCDFYETAPTDEALLTLSRALIADPEHEGLQLVARSGGRAAGFATLFWSWSTTRAARIGIMNDLFVHGDHRGDGIAEDLIAACLECCRERGAISLEWQTAPDNERAQKVYERVGAELERWLDYQLPASGRPGAR